MQCPIDNVDLVMTERSGIEIDYCPKCRGVWLDRGELDKIIERGSTDQTESRVSGPHYGRHGDDDDEDDENEDRQQDNRRHHTERHDQPRDYRDSGRKKKKESFLGDLFDFGG